MIFDAIIVTIIEQAEELTTQITSLLTKIKKATKLEANTLAKLFPSSSKRTVTQAFEPTGDCVALPAQKRKKVSSSKPIKVEVFLLPTLVKKFQEGVTGRYCEKLIGAKKLLSLNA